MKSSESVMAVHTHTHTHTHTTLNKSVEVFHTLNRIKIKSKVNVE